MPSISIDRRRALLRRLALACAVAVLLVTSLSAYMRLSKAGLGCADWPACYGQLATQAASESAAAPTTGMVALARITHRLSAVLVLLLAIGMLMLCFDARAVALRRAGLLALGVLLLALALAVLGRYSSGTRVPAVAIGNLLGGLLMFAACVRLAHLARPHGGPPLHGHPSLRGWAAAAALLVVGQVVLGGLVSASFAGLACDAGGDCGLLDAWHRSGGAGLDPWRDAPPAAAPEAADARRWVHSLHRHVAPGVAVLLSLLGLLAWRRGQRSGALLLWMLLGLQLLAGAWLVLAGLPMAAALLHNLLAALLLATLVSWI